MKPGIIIKKLRASRGMSQEELASRIDIERTYLSAIETGKRSPGMQLIQAVADVFEVPVALLFIEEDDDGRKQLDILRQIWFDLLSAKEKKRFQTIERNASPQKA